MKKTNSNIIFGITLGVAIISLAGFLMMSTAYYEKSKELNTALKAKENNQAGSNNNEPAAAINPSDIKITEADHIRGDKNAPIAIVEFSDFQCPYCQRFHGTMQEIIKNNKDVRWVFKDFPLPSHPFGRKAALAAECAGEQGKFWEYADGLYANQGSISDDYFPVLAKDLKLNGNKFNECLASEKYAKKVDGDQKLGQALGVNATPTSFANGQKIEGAYPYADVMTTINSLPVKAGS